MISIAFTNAVVWKGKIRVSHSQCEATAQINAAVDAKNTNHQMPLFFLVCSIFLFFAKLKSLPQILKSKPKNCT
jgi:hypothetical protein